MSGGAGEPVPAKVRRGRRTLREKVRGIFRPGWKHALGILAVVGLMAVVLVQVPLAVAGRSERAYTQSNLIRLHVVANSDAASDQQLKLDVRDAVLDELTPLLAPVASKAEARRLIAGDLNDLRRAVEREIAENGRDYPVTIRLGSFGFPDRDYGQLVLPAGDYEALRVVIGRGQGANWWCVLFPPLCFLDLREPAVAAAAPGGDAASATASSSVSGAVWAAPGEAGGVASGIEEVAAVAYDPKTPPKIRFFLLEWLKGHGVDLQKLWEWVVAGGHKT